MDTKALTTQQLADLDREYLWHPFTPMKPWCEGKEIVVIERGEREFLVDTEGRKYIDASSSLWCNVHGHCVPELDTAVREQLEKVAHSTLLGLGNVPSIVLGKRLVELARASGMGLDRVFYSDNGSTAVEVACKMAFQYWRCAGEGGRTRFIALDNAYHGDTLGAVSVGGIPTFHGVFKALCFPVDFVTPPDCVNCGVQFPKPVDGRCCGETLKQIERLLAEHPGEYAAIVVEPLVQGAGGMIVHPKGFLAGVRKLADRYGVLLIADEVMTGFGRTGTMFACTQEEVTPDFLCLSKGLTAGYMPLGATLTTRKVFDAFYADPKEGKTFFHGHTFTGHPLACAAALASLDLFDSTRLLVHVHRMGEILEEMLGKAKGMRHVFNGRRVGLIGALDIRDVEGGAYPYHYRIGGALCTRMRSLGVLMRPLGDTLVIMPPLAIREENMRGLCEAVMTGLGWLPEIVEEIAAREGGAR